MKKAIIVGLALIPILLFITSCGVAQEEYDRVSSDLAAAQTQIKSLQDNLTAAQGDLTAAQAQIQSLQGDLTATQTQIQSLQGDLAKAQAQIQPLQEDKETTEEKRAQALAYTEYVDIALYSFWEEAGLTPRFAFESDIEWMTELRDRADGMGDAELSNYLKELRERGETAMNQLWYLCLDRIDKALK